MMTLASTNTNQSKYKLLYELYMISIPPDYHIFSQRYTCPNFNKYYPLQMFDLNICPYIYICYNVFIHYTHLSYAKFYHIHINPNIFFLLFSCQSNFKYSPRAFLTFIASIYYICFVSLLFDHIHICPTLNSLPYTSVLLNN